MSIEYRISQVMCMFPFGAINLWGLVIQGVGLVSMIYFGRRDINKIGN